MTTPRSSTAGGATTNATASRKAIPHRIQNGPSTTNSKGIDGDDDETMAAKYHHPYTPYDVQMQFMKTVYDVCEQGDGQVGILESPTGTGKSLSLLCAALTWLRRHKRSQYEASLTGAETKAALADEPDWVVEQMLRQRRAELAGRWERREARLAAARRRERAAERGAAATSSGGGRGPKRRRVEEGGRTKTARRDENDEDAEFLLDDETTTTSSSSGGARDDNDRLSWFSAETRAMMEKAGLVAGAKGSGEDDEDEDGFQDDIKVS